MEITVFPPPCGSATKGGVLGYTKNMSRTKTVPTTKDKVIHTTDEVLEENIQKKDRDTKQNHVLGDELMYGKQAYKRTVRDTVQERDMRYARLHSFGGKTSVEMFWDLGPEAIQHQVFKIKVGTQEAIISAVEMQKYIRWV